MVLRARDPIKAKLVLDLDLVQAPLRRPRTQSPIV